MTSEDVGGVRRRELKRFGRLVRRYYKHPLYVLVYAMNYFNGSFKSQVQFYSHHDLAKQIANGKSVIRIGDGELYMMTGGSVEYQRYEKTLSTAIRELVRNYRSTAPYIVALPVFLNTSNTELRKERRFPAFFVWMPGKVMYKIFFPKNLRYGDAHFFYYDGHFQRYLQEYLMDKHLVVVSNKDAIASFANNKSVPFKKVSFVITPKEHSYSDYRRIRTDINATIRTLPEGDTPVLVLSSGPSSKQLAYDFSREGIQALDVGRGLEVFYRDESLEQLFPELQRSKTQLPEDESQSG